MRKRVSLCGGACALMLLLAANVGWGQRIRLPQTPAINETAFQGSADGMVVVPQTGVPSYSGAPSTVLGQPGFDPYSTTPNAAATPPTLFGTPPAATQPATPFWQAPGCAPGDPSCGFPSTGYPPGFPQQPPVVLPNGLNFATPGWPQAQPGPYLRFFQDLRFRHTWLGGKARSDQMDLNDLELATTVNFPNFLWSGQPLQISPVFIFHFWAHPVSHPIFFPTELPSRVYSAYGLAHWQPMLTPSLGADLEAGVGVFSDFSTVTSDSVRVFGTGVFLLALTPTITVKGGVNYLDRVDLKLLPAGGILWTPNPQTRFDIFFPKPKLAQYLTTVGNTDIWWYLFGEYGGGSWTVDRALLTGGMFVPNTGDARLDVNDIRAGAGLEWTGQGGLRGFFETAYVFDREIVFAFPASSFSLDNTVMLRAGLAY